MSSPAAPYRTPDSLRRAAEKLRGLRKLEVFSAKERLLLLRVSTTLEALAAGHDVVVQTSITLEPK